MPIRFVDKRTATHYKWWFRLIKINMNKPKKPTPPQRVPSPPTIEVEIKERDVKQGADKSAQLIGPLQTCAGNTKGIIARNRDEEVKDVELVPNPEPVGPLQTCADIEALKRAQRASKPPPK